MRECRSACRVGAWRVPSVCAVMACGTVVVHMVAWLGCLRSDREALRSEAVRRSPSLRVRLRRPPPGLGSIRGGYGTTATLNISHARVRQHWWRRAQRLRRATE